MYFCIKKTKMVSQEANRLAFLLSLQYSSCGQVKKHWRRDCYFVGGNGGIKSLLEEGTRKVL